MDQAKNDCGRFFSTLNSIKLCMILQKDEDKMKNIKDRILEKKTTIPAAFIMICTLMIASLAICVLRGFENIEPEWAFSMGADIISLAICTVIFFSVIQGKNVFNEYSHIFILLLVTAAFQLFLDQCCWTVQSLPQFWTLNLIINVFYFANSLVMINLFWRYVSAALDMNSLIMRIADRFLNFLVIPFLILCFVNFFYPLYFYIDAGGNYVRSDLFIISQIYLALALVIVVYGLITSKATMKDKLVAASFISIPLLNQVLTRYTFGITTQYACMLVSIVLIYGMLFAEREKTLASTAKELSLATRIQNDMLPNIFPAFPERKEFDIYASMNPAKEVGGDFYDFFLIDENMLGMVIADVSGKGIPAALFMMASKILIQNYAMSGATPSQVLEMVNNQICSNNREEMFVTVWFGILNLTNGTLTAANAGHEYPMVKKPGGQFEIVKDRHGFVIGGMPGMKYHDYTIQLDPGASLFVYTDGVPEATNIHNELFGTERALDALNESPDSQPSELLSNVTKAVNRFVNTAPQFDDLTMLCLHYNGPRR